MNRQEIIKATRNSLNIYSFTAEALEKLITAIQSEHKCQTCEALARTVMMDQTAHDTHTAPQREWVGLTDEDVYPLANKYLHHQIEDYLSSGVYNLARAIEAKLKEKNT